MQDVRGFVVAGLLAVGAAPCVTLADPEAVPHGEPPPQRSPPGACLQVKPDALVDLALRVGASGVAVETPCLEVLP